MLILAANPPHPPIPLQANHFYYDFILLGGFCCAEMNSTIQLFVKTLTLILVILNVTWLLVSGRLLGSPQDHVKGLWFEKDYVVI